MVRSMPPTSTILPAPDAAQRAGRADYWLWLGPLLFVIGVSVYLMVRYGGHWVDSDAATFSQVIRSFVRDGRLIPDGEVIYPNGYAYQAISAFLLAATGLDIAALQQVIYPLMVPLIVLPVWALYRELTGSARGAALATVLLFTQPEFLFVVLRSSHEKFSRTLAVLCLYCLVRGFKLRDRLGPLAAHIVLFYLAVYALIATNNLLASSFVFAAATACAFGWLLERRSVHLRRLGRRILRRLTYVTVISLGLVYIFTFYAYPPAQHDLYIVQDTIDRVALLFLDLESQTTNSYEQVAIGWVSLRVYFLVSLANWIILAASFAIFLGQGWRLLWRRTAPESPTQWFLWLLYASFAVQGAFSALADASGAVATNLQHRIFPSFSIVAVALVGGALARWRPPQPYARPVGLALAVGVACIAVLSVFKATNEPLVSNKWTFFHPEELVGIEWSDNHLRNVQVQSDYDERLNVARIIVHGQSLHGNHFYSYPPTGPSRNYVVTTVMRLRSIRLGQPLPQPTDALRVYDNGYLELYHRRPETPYQR